MIVFIIVLQYNAFNFNLEPGFDLLIFVMIFVEVEFLCVFYFASAAFINDELCDFITFNGYKMNNIWLFLKVLDMKDLFNFWDLYLIILYEEIVKHSFL